MHFSSLVALILFSLGMNLEPHQDLQLKHDKIWGRSVYNIIV